MDSWQLRVTYRVVAFHRARHEPDAECIECRLRPTTGNSSIRSLYSKPLTSDKLIYRTKDRCPHEFRRATFADRYPIRPAPRRATRNAKKEQGRPFLAGLPVSRTLSRDGRRSPIVCARFCQRRQHRRPGHHAADHARAGQRRHHRRPGPIGKWPSTGWA